MNNFLIIDHCRIGSLEIYTHTFKAGETDHCRIGSLENYMAVTGADYWDHCRIGSLESAGVSEYHLDGRSLPHRQLRNLPSLNATGFTRSLPHRQLRNIIAAYSFFGNLITAA